MNDLFNFAIQYVLEYLDGFVLNDNSGCENCLEKLVQLCNRTFIGMFGWVCLVG